MEAWALGLAGSPWVLVVLYLFATVDGFFPPIPSESLVIALASLSVAPGGRPALLPVILVAAAGAFTGDQIAYTIGGRVDVRRLRIFRSPRAQAALDWAQRALTERGASFIIAGRYIPVGRVAVNMTAGALRFPRRTFVGLDALASITWACYGAAIGVGAGRVLQGHPIVAIVAPMSKMGESEIPLTGVGRTPRGSVASPTMAALIAPEPPIASASVRIPL